MKYEKSKLCKGVFFIWHIFRFANALKLIKLHLFKYYIAPTLISNPLQCISCVQTHSKYYEMSGLRDRNICNCIDIEEGWVLGCCTSIDNPYHAMTMGFRQVKSRYWAIIKALVQVHNYGLGGAHRDKNGWSSLWQKWVELSMTKMGGTHCGKNGWNWCYRHRDKNGWSSLWQKWVELSMTKMGGTQLWLLSSPYVI